MDPKLSDCCSQEQTLKFDNLKKKKSYRKREKQDFDAIEADTKSTGLDIGDLEVDEQERKTAFDPSSALPKADESLPQNHSTIKEEDESAETSENKFVFSSEMDLWSMQLNETVKTLRKPDAREDLFVEIKVEASEVKEIKENPAPVKALHEKPVGRSVAGALHFLRDSGSLKKKKGEEDDGSKQIQITRKDEFGSDLTLKQAWRKLNYGFYGKEPGKKKHEKRMKRRNYEKRMMEQMGSSSETPSVKRMKQMTAELKTPYILL